MLIRHGSRKLPAPSRALLIAWVGLLSVSTVSLVGAQDPVAPAAAQPASGAAELEELVGRIALYPDDLLSIVLPAATFPLQIVEADRWIAQNKGNAEATPKESWDDSVKALINYPDVVTMMSNDLDWTANMGEAVAADPTAVMDAVQSFRRKAEGAGNLQTDDKQVVTVEEEVVKIVQADPQVIYVPQYEPEVIVVQQTVPVYPTYYPTPYPCYYYPYPPGYSFAAGFFWGATVAFAFDWYGGGIHNDIYINRDTNINIDRGDNVNIDRGDNINNRPTNIDRNTSQQLSQEGRGSWQSKQSPSDVRQGRAPQASTRQAGTGGAQATNRAAGATQGQRTPGASTGASSRQAGGAASTSRNQPSTSASTSRYNNTSRNASAARSSPPSRDAFSGMSSSRSAGAYSSRGSMSRGGGGGGGGRRR